MNTTSLAHLFGDGGADDFRRQFDATEAAPELSPVPPGRYVCGLIDGRLATSPRRGTQSYKLTFRIREGEYEGRLLWHDLWLTSAALSMTKRDLRKIGIVTGDDLDRPPTEGHVVEARVALETDDTGVERNKVKHFSVLRFEPPPSNPFPVDGEESAAGDGSVDDADEPEGSTVDDEPEGSTVDDEPEGWVTGITPTAPEPRKRPVRGRSSNERYLRQQQADWGRDR